MKSLPLLCQEYLEEKFVRSYHQLALWSPEAAGIVSSGQAILEEFGMLHFQKLIQAMEDKAGLNFYEIIISPPGFQLPTKKDYKLPFDFKGVDLFAYYHPEKDGLVLHGMTRDPMLGVPDSKGGFWQDRTFSGFISFSRLDSIATQPVLWVKGLEKEFLAVLSQDPVIDLASLDLSWLAPHVLAKMLFYPPRPGGFVPQYTFATYDLLQSFLVPSLWLPHNVTLLLSVPPQQGGHREHYHKMLEDFSKVNPVLDELNRDFIQDVLLEASQRILHSHVSGHPASPFRKL